ncbi:MAG: hypothetical protein HKP14_11755 [Bacteroidia bacterium]|nr:hypothetical protein [Bacteroidia bacterium]
MKWFFLTLCIGLFGLSNAQNTNVSKAGIFVGLSPESDLPVSLDSQSVFTKRSNKAVIGISYSYQLKERFNFGIQASFHQVPFDIKTNSITIENGTFNVKYLGLLGKFKWLQANQYSLQSGIGMGYDYTTKKFMTLTNSSFQTQLNETYTQLRLSILLAEFEFFLNDNLYINSSVNLGSPTFLSLGAGYSW